jgi:hypothetical protein
VTHFSPSCSNGATANFNKKIAGCIPNATHVRQQILNDFGALFALDGTPEDEHHALDGQNELVALPAKLEIGEDHDDGDDFGGGDLDEISTPDQTRVVAEAETALAELDDDFDPERDSEVRAIFSILQSSADVQDDDFRIRVFRAIMELPREEAEALLLVHYRGLKEESQDPNEDTAAKRCGVTGRTIRNRLARARAKLLRLKEDA